MLVSQAILWVDAILLSAAISWALVVAYGHSPDYVLLRRLFWGIAIGTGIFVLVWDVTAIQSVWVRVPFVALAFAAIGVLAVEGIRWTYREAASVQNPDPQPEIVVVPPSMNYILMWNPPQQTLIQSVPLKEGKRPSELNEVPSPPFRVKNLGSVVAHNVRLHWEQTMDEQQLLAEINKSELFRKYPAPNDKNDMRYKEFTFQIPYLAPEIDNTSYVNVPIPYYVYLYAETYFTAVISGDQLIKDLITVPFRLTISWDRPPGGKPIIFVVTAIARNMHPSPTIASEQFHDEDGKMHPMPKIMAEITFNVEQITP